MDNVKTTAELIAFLKERDDDDFGIYPEYKEIAERLAQQGAALTWQPIETAPKNGTEILVMMKPKDIRLGWYFAPSSNTFGWLDGDGKKIRPTHWAPLPKALQPTTEAMAYKTIHFERWDGDNLVLKTGEGHLFIVTVPPREEAKS